MLQGVADTYIPPPVANATSLSLGLDLAGPSRDVVHPRSASVKCVSGADAGDDFPIDDERPAARQRRRVEQLD